MSKTAVWVVAGFLILGGILFGTQSISPTAMEPLFGGRILSQDQLDQLAFEFSKAGLEGWKREETQILIPRASQAKYLAALEDSPALPYTMQQEEDALKGVSYFESQSTQQLRLRKAKARKLANAIMATFNEVTWAVVEYDFQELGGFHNQTIQSASVILVSRDSKPIAPSRIAMIQEMVSAAYAGMKPDQVTVTDSSARKTYSGADDPHTRQQRQAEYELEQRLTELLNGYRGLRIAVRSLPANDRQADRATNKPVAIAKSIKSDVGPTNYQMHVSVGVPESIFHVQWINDYRTEHPESDIVIAPKADQLVAIKKKVLDNIREAVMPLVAASSPDMVSIWSFPETGRSFNYASGTKRPFKIEKAVAFLRANPVIVAAIGGLAFITLVFAIAATSLRLRSNRSDPIAVATSSSSRRRSTISSESETDNSPQIDLKDDLADLVENNPELAAQIVHSWIAEAA